MLSNLSEALAFADRHGIAIGAFTVVTREDIQGTLRAAEELALPVILQASPFQLQAAGLKALAGEMLSAARDASVPVVVQLDHGNDFDVVCQCLREGFSSVLIDGSQLPYDENVALTRRVVAMAHPMGVSVEAELGHIGGTEDDVTTEGSELTSPEQAAQFAEATQADALAVAIGTAHGTYKSDPKLDFERAAEIQRRVRAPLVLHGGSSLGPEVLQKAISLGFRKVNIGTELKMAHMKALRRFLEANPEERDPRKYLGAVREAVYTLAASKMRLFGGAASPTEPVAASQ